MEREEFGKRSSHVSTLAELLGKPLSALAVTAFVGATDDISFDEFADGIAKATRECRFMPSPVQFREMSVGLPPLPTVAEQNAAELARWGGKRH